VQICSSCVVRGVFTSDQLFESHLDLPREMKFSQKPDFVAGWKNVPEVVRAVTNGPRRTNANAIANSGGVNKSAGGEERKFVPASRGARGDDGGPTRHGGNARPIKGPAGTVRGSAIRGVGGMDNTNIRKGFLILSFITYTYIFSYSLDAR